MVANRKPLEDRFLEKTTVGTLEQCWLWMATKNNKGYGLLQQQIDGANGKRLAHRIAYELFIGPIPEGMCALHRCDTPACVNPNHIFLGTMRDNIADMDAKGRRVTVVNPNNKPPTFRGSAHPHAKLTEEIVLEMRSKLAAGAFVRALSREYKIDRKTIMTIRDRKGWKHI